MGVLLRLGVGDKVQVRVRLVSGIDVGVSVSDRDALRLALREPERVGGVTETLNTSVRDSVRVSVPEWVAVGRPVREREVVAVVDQEMLGLVLALVVQLPDGEAEPDTLPEPLTLGAVLLPVPVPSLKLLKDTVRLLVTVREAVAALTVALTVDPVALPVQE